MHKERVAGPARVFILMLIVLPALLACTSPLTGTKWQAVEIDGHSPSMPYGMTLKFSDSAVEGNADCRNFAARRVSAIGSFIRFQDIIATAVACEGDKDKPVFDALDSVRFFSFKSEQLVLRDALGRVRVRLIRQPPLQPAQRRAPTTG